MSYPDWKKVYIDKTMTLDEWKSGLSKAGSNGKIGSGGFAPRGNYGLKRQQHFSTSDENVLATNPNYKKNLGYQLNCQKCVPAYEMRMRGYDVVAKPTNNFELDVFAQKHWDKAFNGAKIIDKLDGTGKEKIINQMLLWGDGARAEVYVQWRRKKQAHVFVAENRNGYIHFLDPQTGSLDVEDYFDMVKNGGTKFFRIDNLEINELYVKEWCGGIE